MNHLSSKIITSQRGGQKRDTYLVPLESKVHLEISHNRQNRVGEHEALEIKTGIRRKAEAQPLTPTHNLITDAMFQSSGSDHLPKWQS